MVAVPIYNYDKLTRERCLIRTMCVYRARERKNDESVEDMHQIIEI